MLLPDRRARTRSIRGRWFYRPKYGCVEAGGIKGTSGAISAKTVTYDFERLMEGATLLSSSAFGDALIEHM